MSDQPASLAALIGHLDDVNRRRVSIYHQRGRVLITIGGTSLKFRPAAITEFIAALDQAQSAAVGYWTARQQDTAAETGDPDE